jgi:hypothetical protein
MKYELTPLYSEVAPNLFMGGTDDNATIDQAQQLRHFNGRNEFDCVVTLYAWAAPANWGVEERRFGFPDADIIQEYIPTILELAQWAHSKWASGKKVNIRCQAGLNRSGLVTALTLMISGLSADEAINTLRTKRSSYALCNSDYERWLLSEADETLEALKNTKKKASSYSL